MVFAIIGAITGGAVGGAVLDAIGGERDRRAAREAQERGNRFQAEQAQIQREWQERLFGISLDETVSRRVADARRAGISPLAALGVAGAQAPTATSIPGASFGAGRGGARRS